MKSIPQKAVRNTLKRLNKKRRGGVNIYTTEAVDTTIKKNDCSIKLKKTIEVCYELYLC